MRAEHYIHGIDRLSQTGPGSCGVDQGPMSSPCGYDMPPQDTKGGRNLLRGESIHVFGGDVPSLFASM